MRRDSSCRDVAGYSIVSFWVVLTLVALLLSGGPAASAGPIGAPASGTVIGVAFQDCNANGVRDTEYSTATPVYDAGVGGVTITAFDAASGSACGSATPNAPQLANGGASATSNHAVNDVADSDAMLSGGDAVIGPTSMPNAVKLRVLVARDAQPWSTVGLAGLLALLMVALVARYLVLRRHLVS